MRDATENVWVDKNLITANSAAGLDWAKAILEYLDVYPVETINTWHSSVPHSGVTVGGRPV